MKVYERKTSDGVTVDVVSHPDGPFFVRVGGHVIATALTDVTATMRADEALKCWNESPGNWTFAGYEGT